MKENLMLKKYKQELVNGTFDLNETTPFFGSKMLEIEDDIAITDFSISYYQFYIDTLINTGETSLLLAKNNGFQNYTLNLTTEQLFVEDMVNMKLNYHTISLMQQSKKDEENNTRWLINIDVYNLLRQYLFLKIKENRTFKGLKYNNFLNNNINSSIYDYIDKNVMKRIKYDRLDLFIKYYDLNEENSLYLDRTLKQYDPSFDSTIESDSNIVKNINTRIEPYLKNDTLKVFYNQTQSSSEYKFDYYFNIYYKKV